MPLHMDIQKNVKGLTPEKLADAHQRDLEVQDKHGVKYLTHWYSEDEGTVSCLCEASNKEAAQAVHHGAHGGTADEVIEVREGSE
jgi:hypothetical protein